MRGEDGARRAERRRGHGLDQGQVEVKESGADLKARAPVCGSRELISWRLTQKYFFNETFGGAVIKGRRNIFDTTLSFSGIAFLTEPRAISPLISRLRVRTSEHMDVEWDFDLDTGAKKFTSNNVMVDVHEGNVFGGLSYARLNAPGRFYHRGGCVVGVELQSVAAAAGVWVADQGGAGSGGECGAGSEGRRFGAGAVWGAAGLV